MAHLVRQIMKPAQPDVRAIEVDALWHLGRALAICTAACIISVLGQSGDTPHPHPDATLSASGPSSASPEQNEPAVTR